MNRSRPNFLFILTDQQRFDAVGFVGSRLVRTPNLDRLARHGVYFTHSYCAQAVCSPSRASIFSGLFPTTHRVTDNVYGIEDVASSDDYRMSDLWPGRLQKAGYRTCYIGKWHLGEKGPACFDEWHGFNSLLPHWTGEPQKSKYRTEVEADQAIEFLRRNRDNPFVLCLSHYPPHTPYTAPDRFVSLYENTPLKPKEYYGAVSAVDHHVGRVITKLRDLGLADNTVVVFTSDHGDHFGARPGNAHKRGAYDDCARVPLVFYAPRLIESPQVRSELVSNVDLMPTLLELASVDAPRIQHGVSLTPLLRGEHPSWRSAVCIQNTEGTPDDEGGIQSRGVRTSDWKLMLRERLSDRALSLRELYDHRSDAGERANVYGRDNADVVRALILEIDYWARQIVDREALRLTAACARDLGL